MDDRRSKRLGESAGGFRAITGACGALVLVLASASAAGATTINVTGTADENSSSPSNLICTLREAILAANGNLAVGACPAGTRALDTIVLPVGNYVLTIAGAGEDLAETGDLDLLGDTEIIGAGAATTTIDANGLDRIFEFWANDVSLKVSGVTLRGGNATVGTWGGAGGAVCMTGSAPIPPFGYTDCSQCELTIEDAVVRNNSAHDGGAGIFDFGSTAPIQIARSSFTQNSSSDVFVIAGQVTATESTFDSNLDTNSPALGASGGGITLERSTVSNNPGGGVAADGFDPPGMGFVFGAISVRNSTISGNGVAGVYTGNASLSILSSTIVAPSTAIGVQAGASSTFGNTLVSGLCFPNSSTYSQGGNLESPNNYCGFNATGDQVNVADPKLSPLSSYGGPTKTHALLPGSPAIGAGLAANCPATDQRNIARPYPTTGNCDVGAYEYTGCGASLSVAAFAPVALVLRRRRRG